MRNRRYTTRKGPLVVYAEDSGIVRAFRNIPGVDVARVDRLNLLQVRACTLDSCPSFIAGLCPLHVKLLHAVPWQTPHLLAMSV